MMSGHVRRLAAPGSTVARCVAAPLYGRSSLASVGLAGRKPPARRNRAQVSRHRPPIRYTPGLTS